MGDQAVAGEGWQVFSKDMDLIFVNTMNLKQIMILNLTNMTWTKKNLTTQEATFPENRIRACMTFFNRDLILIGGMGMKGKAMNNIWKMDLKNLCWEKVVGLKPMKLGMDCTAVQVDQETVAIIEGKANDPKRDQKQNQDNIITIIQIREKRKQKRSEQKSKQLPIFLTETKTELEFLQGTSEELPEFLTLSLENSLELDNHGSMVSTEESCMGKPMMEESKR